MTTTDVKLTSHLEQYVTKIYSNIKNDDEICKIPDNLKELIMNNPNYCGKLVGIRGLIINNLPIEYIEENVSIMKYALVSKYQPITLSNMSDELICLVNKKRLRLTDYQYKVIFKRCNNDLSRITNWYIWYKLIKISKDAYFLENVPIDVINNRSFLDFIFRERTLADDIVNLFVENKVTVTEPSILYESLVDNNMLYALAKISLKFLTKDVYLKMFANENKYSQDYFIKSILAIPKDFYLDENFTLKAIENTDRILCDGTTRKKVDFCEIIPKNCITKKVIALLKLDWSEIPVEYFKDVEFVSLFFCSNNNCNYIFPSDPKHLWWTNLTSEYENVITFFSYLIRKNKHEAIPHTDCKLIIEKYGFNVFVDLIKREGKTYSQLSRIVHILSMFKIPSERIEQLIRHSKIIPTSHTDCIPKNSLCYPKEIYTPEISLNMAKIFEKFLDAVPLDKWTKDAIQAHIDCFGCDDIAKKMTAGYVSKDATTTLYYRAVKKLFTIDEIQQIYIQFFNNAICKEEEIIKKKGGESDEMLYIRSEKERNYWNSLRTKKTGKIHKYLSMYDDIIERIPKQVVTCEIICLILRLNCYNAQYLNDEILNGCARYPLGKCADHIGSVKNCLLNLIRADRFKDKCLNNLCRSSVFGQDKDFCLTALNYNLIDFSLILDKSCEVWNVCRKTLVRTYFETCKSPSLDYEHYQKIRKHLEVDPDLCSLIVRKDPSAIAFLNRYLTSYEEVRCAYINFLSIAKRKFNSKRKKYYWYLPPQKFFEPPRENIELFNVEESPNFEFLKFALRNGLFLKKYQELFNNNQNFCMMAVKESSSLFKKVPEKFITEEMCKYAENCIEHVPSKFKTFEVYFHWYITNPQSKHVPDCVKDAFNTMIQSYTLCMDKNVLIDFNVNLKIKFDHQNRTIIIEDGSKREVNDEYSTKKITKKFLSRSDKADALISASITWSERQKNIFNSDDSDDSDNDLNLAEDSSYEFDEFDFMTETKESEFDTEESESETEDSKSETEDSKSETEDSKSETEDSKSETEEYKSSPKPETEASKSDTEASKSSPKPEAEESKSDTEASKSKSKPKKIYLRWNSFFESYESLIAPESDSESSSTDEPIRIFMCK